MYEFEKHQRLTEFIQEMANTGKVPQEWTSFIETLNQALQLQQTGVSKSVCDHSWMNTGMSIQGKRLMVCTKCRETKQTVC